jgi:hypothetical protein
MKNVKNPSLDRFNERSEDGKHDKNWGLKNTLAADKIADFAHGSEGCPLVVKTSDGTLLAVKNIAWGYDSQGQYTILIETA